MRDIRLGDDIDDFCIRCKRLTNHVVVSVLKGAPAKVRCRTCHNDHDFRNEQAPPPKVDLRKQALFNEVLKKVTPGESAVDADALAEEPAVVEDLAVEDAAEDADVELAAEAVAGVEEDPIPAKPEPEPAPKSKPKSKAKAKAKIAAKGRSRK